MSTDNEVARGAAMNDSPNATHTAHPTDAYEHTSATEETVEKDVHSSATSQDEQPHDEEKGLERVASTSDGVPLDQRSKGKVALIMAALMMAVFLAALDVTIITTALPTITEHFHSSSGYSWIGSGFLLANAASIPSWGKISDIFGRKPMLLAANVIFLVGSLIAALSVNIGMLIAARAIQGIGAGGLIILVNITIGDLFSLRSRGAFYGLIGAVWAIASAIGPVIGGAFTQHVSWRWCFYINLPLDGIALFIIFFFLDLKTPTTPLMEGLKAIDWIGTLAIIGATLMFLFGLQLGGAEYPWGSATVVCLLVFSGVLFVLFGIWEWKYAKYPVIPMQLFSKGSNIATLLVVFAHGFVFISGSYYLPLWFQAIKGAAPLKAGVDILPTALSLAATSIGTGIFIKKTGWFLPPIWFGMLLMALGYGLFIDLDAHSSWAKLILYQIVSGLGTGPLFQSPIIALQAHIHPRDIATGTATLGFVRQLATSSSVVIGQVVYQNIMNKKKDSLTAALGPKLAAQLSGASVGANTQLIDSLPPAQAEIVRVDFANSLKYMWILYTAAAAAGLIAIPFIKRKVLTKKHEETKTGLEAEKENAAERLAEKEAKKESKRQSRAQGSNNSSPVIGGPTDSEPASPSTPKKHGLGGFLKGGSRSGTPKIDEEANRDVSVAEKGQA